MAASPIASPASGPSTAFRLGHGGRLVVALLLAAAVAVLFAPAGGYGFVDWDDPVYVSANPHVLGGLSRESVVWAWTTRHAANWHPLTWMSHMLDVDLFGPGPSAPHRVNVALHVLNTLLVLVLFWRLSPHRPLAGLTAAPCVGLHPRRGGSVAWVAERKDVLCGLFALLALLAYLGGRRRGGRWRHLAVTLAVAAALAAKPMAVTLPLIFLLLDLWPLREEGTAFDWRRRLLEKLPWAVLAAGTALATIAAQHGGGAVAGRSELALGARLANAALAIPRYVALTLRPHGLAALYPHPWLPGGEPPSSDAIAIRALAVIVACGLAWRLLTVRRARAFDDAVRPVAFGWLLFVVALLPTLGLVQVGEQALADRYSYLPHVGLLWALVSLVAALLDRLRVASPALARGAGSLLALASIALAAGRTHAQLPAWSSTETLFRRSLAAEPRNPVLQYHLGRQRMIAGDPDEAESLLHAALASRPRFAEPHRLLGLIEEGRGRRVEAARELDLAVGMVPDYLAARLDLVRVLIDLEAWSRAEDELRRALDAAPDSPLARFELGRLRERQGRFAEAEAAWREAAKLAPDWDEPQRALAALPAASSVP